MTNILFGEKIVSLYVGGGPLNIEYNKGPWSQKGWEALLWRLECQLVIETLKLTAFYRMYCIHIFSILLFIILSL